MGVKNYSKTVKSGRENLFLAVKKPKNMVKNRFHAKKKTLPGTPLLDTGRKNTLFPNNTFTPIKILNLQQKTKNCVQKILYKFVPVILSRKSNVKFIGLKHRTCKTSEGGIYSGNSFYILPCLQQSRKNSMTNSLTQCNLYALDNAVFYKEIYDEQLCSKQIRCLDHAFFESDDELLNNAILDTFVNFTFERIR